MTNSEKSTSSIGSKSAALISLTLCLPFLISYFAAVLELTPWARVLTSGGLRPNILGYIVLVGGLACLPIAFLINLLPMVTRAGTERRAPFRPAPAHTVIGVSILFAVLFTWADGVRHELRPFVAVLGSGAAAGQILFFVGLLVLPVAFLLNRLPRLVKPGCAGALTFQPASINLIIGAAILLVILMIGSSFILEGIACSIGVPNCD